VSDSLWGFPIKPAETRDTPSGEIVFGTWDDCSVTAREITLGMLEGRGEPMVTEQVNERESWTIRRPRFREDVPLPHDFRGVIAVYRVGEWKAEGALTEAMIRDAEGDVVAAMLTTLRRACREAAEGA
jgi:hypothetical protein